jgi:hypothetical protein
MWKTSRPPLEVVSSASFRLLRPTPPLVEPLGERDQVLERRLAPCREGPLPPVVAYHRVSTERQGRSGLGLDAQRERCAAFAAAQGYVVAEAFAEVETQGKRMRSGRSTSRVS